jgi:DNA-binding MarR family transcriptional regulator
LPIYRANRPFFERILRNSPYLALQQNARLSAVNVDLNRLDKTFSFMHSCICRQNDTNQAITGGRGERWMNYELRQNERTAAETLHRLNDFLPYKISILASSLNDLFETMLEERHSIGLTDWRVMATLGEYGSMTAKDICDRGRMHKTKVSRAVASLENRRLLMRRTNRDDMREAFLSLTDRGRDIYHDVVPLALSFSSRLTDRLAPGDLLVVERALDQLIRATEIDHHVTA